MLKQSRDHKHALSLVVCHPDTRINMAYLCTKFDDFRCSRSQWYDWSPWNFNDFYWGQLVVRRLRLAHLTCTSNLESLCDHQLRRWIRQRKMQKLRWFKVVRCHPRSTATQPFDRVHTTWTSYLNLIETMKLSRTVLETLSLIFKN